MIVVSDTGPINYLLQINAIRVLPLLYTAVIIPDAVEQELLHPDAPEVVRAWAARTPDWISVRAPQYLLPLLLGPGERAAISLALELNAGLILVDDRQGRQAARLRNLPVTGTLGVLSTAAQNGLLDFADAVKSLDQTNFYAAPDLVATLLSRIQAHEN